MHPRLPQWFGRAVALVCVTFPLRAAAQTVPAATEPPAADGDVVVLSPFTIQASSDAGYEASESLAGTGLATKLTDLGAAISDVTPRFFEDTGSTSLRDVLVYQSNTEVTGLGGNLSGATPSVGGVTSEPSFTNSTSTRVRGLAEATQARNFFRNVIPLDVYNTERIDINRGANSLLFGVGSPAGIINYTTLRPEIGRSFREVTLQYGSNDSQRASFDLNQVIVGGQLAVRLAGVADYEKYRQKPAYNDAERLYGAIEWRIKALERGILSGTTLRANFEDGTIYSNNPRVLPPTDRLSPWFDSGLSPELQALGARPKATYDPRQNVGGRFTPALGTVSLGVIHNVNRSPTYVFQDNLATVPRDNIQPATGGPLLGRGFVSNNAYFAHNNTVGTAATAYVRETSRILADAGFPDAQFYMSQHFSDPSIFNFFENLIDGPNKEERTNFQSKDLALEQVLLGGDAGFEVAYNLQKADESRQSLIPSGQPWISIDTNTHMWTGEVNPNFGRPFISTGGEAAYNDTEVETTRAKAFYRLDLEDKLDGFRGRALGRHVFSLLGQREKFTTDSRGGGTTHYTPDLWTNGSTQSRRIPQAKQIVTWHYIGDSVFDRDDPAGLDLPALAVNRLNFQDSFGGQGLVLGRLIPPNAQTALQNLPQYQPMPIPITVLREDRQVSNTAASATRSERTLDSRAFAIQSTG